jgi:2-polyprenyl-3-methyl-5-hydroxy-6-metoxy-1,4-benzoquinol methylase
MAADSRHRRRCGLCAGDQFRHWWTRDGYDIGACQRCGLVQVTEEVSDEELTALYGRGYYEGENDVVYANYLADPEAKGRYFGDRLDRLTREHDLRPGSLLEVGCAFGLFLDQARRRGWQVRGIERSAHAAEWARTSLHLDVDSSPDAIDHIPSDSQDLVVLLDVIEHLKDPLAVVQAAHRVLRPGGMLAVTTGNISSIGARVYGRRWFLIGPPYHLFYFDHGSITGLLERAGFAMRQIISDGGHPLENAGRGSRALNWIAKHDRYIGWRFNSGPTMEAVAVKR